jgi:hypothetical protein
MYVTLHNQRYRTAAYLAAVLTAVILGVTPSQAWGDSCPNQAVRTGPSAALPDCRAYELVTPPDTDGRRIESVGSKTFSPPYELFPVSLASSGGGSLVFGDAATPLAGQTEPSGYYDVYVSDRTADGWQVVRSLMPSGAEAVSIEPGGFSDDHRYSMFEVSYGQMPPRGTLALPGITSYLRGTGGAIDFTAKGSLGGEPAGQGRYISEDGRHVIFSTGGGESSATCQYTPNCAVLKLEPNAAPTGTGTIYDRSVDGPTHVVSLLPPNIPQAAGQEAFYQGTSKDASSIAFKIEGTLYVRINNGEEGEETLQAAEGNPVYAGLSADGRYLFYVAGGHKGTIHRFDTVSKADLSINPTAAGEVVNVSADGSHVYFIAEEPISAQGSVGEPNLFSWSGNGLKFIRTVAASDLVVTSGPLEHIPALTRWTQFAVAPYPEHNEGLKGPGGNSSRTTPDGEVLVFESKAKLTGYENAGHTEIYRWDDGTEELTCVSCNPLTPEAIDDARLQNLAAAESTVAVVGTPIIVHNVSNDGTRVFFETPEAMVSRDTDGINDIYQWSIASGSAPSIDLISSGASEAFSQLPKSGGAGSSGAPNTLLSVTGDGNDVFFLSLDALVPKAGVGGVPAIYDARVGGGFLEPQAPVPCLEEGCRTNASRRPVLTGPSSEAISGSGNVTPRTRRHCKKHGKTETRNRASRRCSRHRSQTKPGKKRARRSEASGQTLSHLWPPTESKAPAAEEPSNSNTGAQTDAEVSASPTTAAAGEFDEIGLESVSAGASTSAAAAHPDFSTTVALNSRNVGGERISAGKAREVAVALPPGLVGYPTNYPTCKTGELIAYNCPVASQIGLVEVSISNFGTGIEPLFNLAVPHPEREVARLGFPVIEYNVFIDVDVRTAGDYGVTATVHDAPGVEKLVAATTTIWGNPSDPSHDAYRLTAREAITCHQSGIACEAPGGKREVPRTNLGFMTNPSACQEGEVAVSMTSYQLPGQIFTKSALMAPTTECQGLPLAPHLEARPTTDVAGAPTGLKTRLVIPQHEDAGELSTATMREARVTLPEGMAINPSAADGLAVCSDEQVHLHQEADAECPDASKLGSAIIDSPAIANPFEGSLYQRAPGGKGNQFRLWLISDDLGLHIKIPGEVKPDPQTGQLTVVFAGLPQVPVQGIDIDIWGGARAPLKNPDACGTYQTTSVFTPWSSDPPAESTDSYSIDRAPNGGPCPTAATDEPNSPGFEAGTTRPIAATFSPLVLRLRREDGSQPFGKLEVTMPPGLLGKLAGVSECPDAALEAAAARSGAEEEATPSCGPGSLIGTARAAAGAGPAPFWTQGKVYLAGPYKGAPLSVAIITPATAGPFDLGNVVVRSALHVDPESGRITVESDPIPQLVEGVPLNLRTIAVDVDRDQFILNGTSCEPLSFQGEATSVFNSIAPLSARFQLAECARLPFKPKLSLALEGSTKRSAHPVLSADLTARPGDANIGRAQVKLPHAAFLDNAHIGTACTRVQFAADKCPKRSVYGTAWARTPLLDYRLSGPVYLRSSNHLLPDLVIKLKGPAAHPLEFDLVGRIDSVKGSLRNTFETVPDAPVSRFHLQLFGGERGLIELSDGLCRNRRASIEFGAQNGRRIKSTPNVKASCGGKKRRGH